MMNSKYSFLSIPEPICTDRSGWPWEPSDPSNLPDVDLERTWPRITVVTPSYNQAEYLEETIRSVLLQGYPNLEYIVIDGGSTDNSADVIKHYESHLAYWVSEPDSGQTNAINKGWTRATGDYVTWLNSDDLLLPGSLFTTAAAMLEDDDLDIVYGNARYIGSDSEQLPPPYDMMYGKPWSLPQMIVEWRNPTPQQGFLIKRSLLDRIGYLDEAYHFTMDFDFWVRIAVAGGHGKWVNKPIADFRQHLDAKTSTMQLTRIDDRFRIYNKVYKTENPPKGFEKKAKESRANLHLDAVYYAYLADNGGEMRSHIHKYLTSEGITGTAIVWKWYILSFFTDRGIGMFRTMYRRSRKMIVATSHK